MAAQISVRCGLRFMLQTRHARCGSHKVTGERVSEQGHFPCRFCQDGYWDMARARSHTAIR